MQVESHCARRGLHRPGLALIFATTASVMFSTASCGSGGSSTATNSPTITVTRTLTRTPSSPSTSNQEPSTPQYLSNLTPLSSSSGTDNGSAQVNGKGYSQSVTVGVNKNVPVNFVEYDLGRHWKTLEATIGLRDDSPTGGELTFEVFADQHSIRKETVQLGTSSQLRLPLGDALRLKLVVTYSGSEEVNWYYGVWGDAQLES